jgi:orotate phosphoribosyltransferase
MPWKSDKENAAREIVSLLYQHRMIRTFYRDKPEGWTLVSGLYSPLYVQLRPIISYPSVFEKVCRAMGRMIGEEAPELTKIIGIAMAGVPFAAGLALLQGISAGFTRKMEKVKSVEAFRKVVEEYGEHALVEGEITTGDKIGLVDDLVTRFDSKLIAMEQVKYEIRRRNLADVECSKVIVLLDREQGGQAAAEKEGIDLMSLIPFKTVGLALLEGLMEKVELETLRHYLDDPQHFQNKEVQAELALLAGKA